jgi:two-component system, cell cycle response regulator
MNEKNSKNISEALLVLEKIYDVVRIVDPVINKVIYAKHEKTALALDETTCYGFWKKDKFCNNCISVRALAQQETFVKFETVGNRVYMITASPFQYNNQSYVVEMFSDITDKSILENVVAKEEKNFSDVILKFNDAFVKDELTKIFNRRFINERLPVEIVTNTMSDTTACLVMIDIDSFKLINDNYGHIVGDEILRQFAALLKDSVGGSKDWVARYGGDEFLIYLDNVNIEQAGKITERIRNLVEGYNFTTQKMNFKLTSSIGVSVLKNKMDMEAWINAADKNLYVSKAEGGNKVISTLENSKM